MLFSEALHAFAELCPLPELSRLQTHIDPAWIEQALTTTDSVSLRRRRLPAEQVLWLVLGLALYRDWPIAEVAKRLELALPVGEEPSPVVRSALSKARQRVGAEPLAWLFERTAQAWSARADVAERWYGLSVFALDGALLRTPDTEVNRAHFGSANTSSDRESAYPVLRVVALQNARSRVLAGASIGTYRTAELTLAQSLWPHVPDQAVTLIDKGFYSADVLLSLQGGGTQRHWLIPARQGLKATVVAHYGPGDEGIDMRVSPQARKKNPALPERWQARRIRYQVPGFPPRELLTSLPAEQYRAEDIIALYHERWEVELGFREIKSALLDNELTLRSKTVDGVYQELWGVLLAYNLIRLEINAIAQEAGVAPNRISFVMAMREIQQEFLWAAISSTPGSLPAKLRRLRGRVKDYIVPERRKDRAFPRAVKMSKTHYPVRSNAAPLKLK